MIGDERKACCNTFKKGMKQIIDQNVYCYGRPAAPSYTSFPFKYCPWCGTIIEREIFECTFPSEEWKKKHGKGTLITKLEGEK